MIDDKGEDLRAQLPMIQRSPEFRDFLRALAVEIDAQAGPQGRDTLLRGVGQQMARLRPLPAVTSMEALELEMNETLAAMGWGRTHIALQEAERCLVISHSDLPRVGSKGEPAGLWLAAVLEGLYETWMAQQPGADASLTARRQPSENIDVIKLHYKRG